MKKFLLLFVAIAAIVFTGCSKNDGEESQKALEVTVNTGETYVFGSMIDEVLIAPNKFYAEAASNGIKGIHAGTTTAQVKSGGVTYDCKIIVSAKNTLYVDMMYLLGADLESIIKVYGDPLKQEGDSYLFGPLGGFGLEKGNIFQFKDGKLQVAMIVFSSSYAKQIGAHLADRYVLAAKKDYSLLFINGLTPEDWTVGALVSIEVSAISVFYASKEYLESPSSQKALRLPFKDLL